MGEHLPCKQGVESSNLLVSMMYAKEVHRSGKDAPYLENRILKEANKNIETKKPDPKEGEGGDVKRRHPRDVSEDTSKK